MCLPLTMKRPPRQEQLRQAAPFLVTSPLDSSVATSNSAASDPCPCLQTHNVITVALPHFHGETGRIELAGPVRRCGQAPKSPISQTGESMEKKKQNKENKICAATILHCTPQRKQTKCLPMSSALLSFARCALPLLAGELHPSLLLALAAPHFGYWAFSVYLATLKSSKAASGERHPLPVTSIHCAVKSNPLWTEIISTVSRRISTTCFSPSKSDCSVKTCCSASSSISCFQTERAGGSREFKGKKSPIKNFF